MPIIDMKDMLKHARSNKYAVSSFTITNLDILTAVIDAAEENHSPVILIVPYHQVDDRTLKLLMPAIEAAAINTSVPVAIQARCNHDSQTAIKGINAGCNALMLDNIDIDHIKNITKTAHDCGITVEGRLNNRPDVFEAILFVEETNVDLLNLTMEGTSEGNITDPYLARSILNELQVCQRAALVLNVNSNLNEEHCHQYIAHGIVKVNFDTLLQDVIDTHLCISQEDTFTGYSNLMLGIHAIVRSEAAACMQLCQSNGKAKAMLNHCTPWLPIEHLIIFNVSDIDDVQAKAMMTEGKKSLSTLPGVRSVVTATAIKEDAQFRFSWLIRFCHPSVIDSYRDHPVHVDFADRLFRPVAGDRISIDYQWNSDQAQQEEVTGLLPPLMVVENA
ncbi:MAG: class II fructose-bisphosphate aldolase [Gammaproteobacteria bacterium]|nr:class II fructose-bisphosphate aldolase [Gammaproteobacteria bacterium]